MRRIMLVVGIGTGLFTMAALHNTDSMAVELVHKTNFNLPKVVPPAPVKGVHEASEDLGASEVNVPADEPLDLPSNDNSSARKLVLKKNFNLPPAPGSKAGSVIDPFTTHGFIEPAENAEIPPFPDEYYRPPVMFPLPNGGNDHVDSPDHTDRTAGNDRRRSPRP